MMMWQILKFVDSPETQKPKYLDNETLFLENSLMTDQEL